MLVNRAVLILMIPFFATSCAGTRPKAEPVEVGSAAGCVNPVDQTAVKAIHREASLLEAPPARSGVGVLAFPPNKDSLAKMNQMAVLGVRAFAQKQNDLPIGAIFFSPKGVEDSGKAVRTMPPIFPHQHLQHVPPGEARDRLGPFTASAFYFVPIRLLKEAGILGIRFNQKVASIPIIKLPMGGAPPYLASMKEVPLPNPNSFPDPETTIGILRRDFCWGQEPSHESHGPHGSKTAPGGS